MKSREMIDSEMRKHYQQVWQAGDAWEFESSPFEEQRYQQQLSLLNSRHHHAVLEIGCGSGVFTPLLAQVADYVLALDIAEAAIQRAKHRPCDNSGATVEFLVANVMEIDLEERGPWDLIVLSETIYCLGWLYSFFDVAWFASRLYSVTRAGGQLLLANTKGHENDYLMRPWILKTYRDLFVNIGYVPKREEIFRGTKNGVEFEVLMSLLSKPERS